MNTTELSIFMCSKPDHFERFQTYPYSAKDMVCRLSECSKTGLTLDQFVAVRYAKGGSFSSSYKLCEKKIKTKTSEAFGLIGEPRKALEKLISLDGIGFSMATAILAWVFPKQFSILDSRVRQSLRTLSWQLDLGRQISTNPNRKIIDEQCRKYVEYSHQIKGLADIAKRTPQQIDVWFYNFAKFNAKKSASQTIDLEAAE